MLHGLTWAPAVVVGAVVALVAWALLSRPAPLTWHYEPRWGVRFIGNVGIRLQKGLTPDAVTRAEVLGITPRDLVLMGLIAGLVGGGLGAVFIQPFRWIGVVIGALMFYIAPSSIVNSRFKNYQQAMQTAFENHVLLLQIYLSLRKPIMTALKAMRDTLSGYPQRELDQLLADLTDHRGDQAFVEWGHRTQLPEYRLLANTIVQQRRRTLNGDSLEPLDTLLAANRQENMLSLTNRLGAGGVIVPMLATFAIATLWMYGLFAGVSGLSSLRIGL